MQVAFWRKLVAAASPFILNEAWAVFKATEAAN